MSKEYRGKKVVIYPAYLDINKSRKEGRRVPKYLAVQDPTVDEIATVAKTLGLNPEVQRDVKYPKNHSRKGRVIVDEYISKQKTLVLIAKALKEYRSQKSSSSS